MARAAFSGMVNTGSFIVKYLEFKTEFSFLTLMRIHNVGNFLALYQSIKFFYCTLREIRHLLVSERFIEPVCLMSENGANSPTTTPGGNSEIR